MDLGTASALNLYQFQATASASGQSAAVLQALTRVYTDSMASAGADPASQLLMTAGLAPVADAMNSLAAKDSGSAGTVPLEVLQSYLTFGGVNAASASVLFASTAAPDSGGGQGFDAALNATSALALAAYQAKLDFPSTPPLNRNPVNLLG